MGYKVLARFQDRDGEVYVKGERYSKTLDEHREKTLTTTANKYNKPFLERLGDKGSPNLSNSNGVKARAEYEKFTVKELKEKAKDLDLDFNSKTRKDELIDLMTQD